MISLIVAHDEQRGIGKDGWMPWHLPQDLAHFKRITLHHTILMGRTTFAAMKKPLPDRFTFVATQQREVHYDDAQVAVIHDLNAFLTEWQEKDEILYVCGGSQIYAQALPFVEEMWITKVKGVFPADTYFPVYNEAEFDLVEAKSNSDFTICHYVKHK